VAVTVSERHLNVTWGSEGVPLSTERESFQTVEGIVLTRWADDVEIIVDDGTTVHPRVIWVSPPIEAGFFFYRAQKGRTIESVLALEDSEVVTGDTTGSGAEPGAHPFCGSLPAAPDCRGRDEGGARDALYGADQSGGALHVAGVPPRGNPGRVLPPKGIRAAGSPGLQHVSTRRTHGPRRGMWVPSSRALTPRRKDSDCGLRGQPSLRRPWAGRCRRRAAGNRRERGSGPRIARACAMTVTLPFRPRRTSDHFQVQDVFWLFCGRLRATTRSVHGYAESCLGEPRRGSYQHAPYQVRPPALTRLVTVAVAAARGPTIQTTDVSAVFSTTQTRTHSRTCVQGAKTFRITNAVCGGTSTSTEPRPRRTAADRVAHGRQRDDR
jgi:hypothetical protein